MLIMIISFRDKTEKKLIFSVSHIFYLLGINYYLASFLIASANLDFFLVPLFSHKRALIEIKEQNFPPKRLCSCRRNGSKKEGIHQLLKTQRLSNGWRYGSGDQVQVKHCSHVTQKDESTLACLSFLPQIRQKKPLVWSGLGYHHC